MNFKRITLIIVSAFLFVLSSFTSAFADWYDDVKSGCTWVEIKGDEFVVDTFCGVEARYNENDYYYQCNELIMRFYKEAYNLEVLAYMNTGLVMLTEGYGFVETDTPKKGDVIYVTAAMRNSGSDHWAIVKDYSNGYITMFEQNTIWDGKAALNRQIKFPSDSYYLLTPVSLGLAPDPVLKGVENETTTKPTTTTTTKPVTTTTKPATTTTTTTTATTTTTTTTTATATLPETTTQLPSVTETQPELTGTVSTTLFEETSEETIRELAEETDTKKPKTVTVIVACAALVVVSAIVTAVLLKKKR